MEKQKVTIFLFLITATFCFSQNRILPAGVYNLGDTTLEIKYFKDLNSIREFKKVKNRDIILYKDYYMDTRILREEGVFKDGWSADIWRYYDVNGKLEKEIDFDKNTKTLYGKTSEPYDDVFKKILHVADSLLIEKYGLYFFMNHIILNSNHSYHYGSGTPGSWFEVPDYRPNEFLMRYDIILDGNRFSFFEFTLDSSGKLKKNNSLKSISNLKNQNFLTFGILDSIAVNQGLTHGAKPFVHKLFCSQDSLQKDTGKLEIHVLGMPYNKERTKNVIIEYYYYVVLDPWTGDFIRKDTGKTTTVFD